MITEIDVRDMLASTGQPHCDLVTRPTGRAVRTSIEAELGTIDRAHIVVLDFTDIRLMDCSCADEVLARLVQATPGIIVVRGLAEHHLDPVHNVLQRQHLALVAVREGAPILLGWVAERGRAAFERLAQLGGAAAEELADALAWPVAETVAALDELALRRLVIRAADRYHPPSAA